MIRAVVCLLALDGLTTTWLYLRHRRPRRARREQAVRPSVITDETTLARTRNEVLARRQALQLMQRSTHPAHNTPRGNAPDTVRQAVAGAGTRSAAPPSCWRRRRSLCTTRPIWET